MLGFDTVAARDDACKIIVIREPKSMYKLFCLTVIAVVALLGVWGTGAFLEGELLLAVLLGTGALVVLAVLVDGMLPEGLFRTIRQD